MDTKRKVLFTSESVSEGHPDKVCDQISDAVLDACLREDSTSRVACETFTTTGMVLVGGEISTSTYVNLQDVVRGVVKRIGYDRPEYGLDWESMAVIDTIHNQSSDISMGVTAGENKYKSQGAGDQGMMFGFACNETEELMPAPIIFAHRLLQKAAAVRKSGECSWMRPDAKSQVTVQYEGGKPVRIDTIVISHQHSPSVSIKEIEASLRKRVIEPVLGDTGLIDEKTRFFINPTGRFVIGGPHGDSGLTGRKIIVDTYGGMGRHGGGAFSGKDPSKVDRSAAYMARYVAKNIVAAGLCDRCELELSYAIGVPFPISVMVDTFGTATVPEERIEAAVEKVFDLSPEGIIRELGLLAPIYEATAAYGHFGRDGFSWERVDKTEELKKAVG
ncbi:methionine adenosyltransferase [Sediminispirochaeta smaragdinae]|jgi:S-adenosylmethionine synthetase|uniref:S-adenosylmethionine synthase n=1 Tax=Sediminispirochaeta smaragdinae (strain DSM 11293 / JCM 15392 / SEBR 4228) TaxID=573413 RepID=E1R6N8_SEDSS|nr:methionine adenosyltransferase [Sediminispirochaeta smaragdinae]ADK79170.1 S-adenosylmethionine synthetase [Sediminispirochaeta smaragdinae DSM 11293]